MKIDDFVFEFWKISIASEEKKKQLMYSFLCRYYRIIFFFMALGFISKYGIFKKLLLLQASSCVQFQCWRKSKPISAWASKSERKYFSTLRNIYTFDKQNSSADCWLGETLGCNFPLARTVPCPKDSCFLILKILKRPYLKIYKIKLAPVQYPCV